MGEASRQKCFESVSRAFELGWMTVKLRDTISDLELYSADKIGNIDTDLHSDHIVLCLEYCDVMHDVYKKDSDRSLCKQAITRGILTALSQALVDTGVFSEEEIGAKLCGAFVLGYTLAKYPKRFKHYRQ